LDSEEKLGVTQNVSSSAVVGENINNGMKILTK
jgi:hypothetical protein